MYVCTSVENYRDVGALPLYLLIIAKLLRVHLFRKKIYIAAEELSSEHRSPAELFSYVKEKMLRDNGSISPAIQPGWAIDNWILLAGGIMKSVHSCSG
jgi:hypothetical protein